MDNLIISFMYHVNAIIDAGKIYAEEALLKHKSSITVDLPKLVMFLKWFPGRDKTLNYSALNRVAYDMLPEAQYLGSAGVEPISIEYNYNSKHFIALSPNPHYLKPQEATKNQM